MAQKHTFLNKNLPFKIKGLLVTCAILIGVVAFAITPSKKSSDMYVPVPKKVKYTKKDSIESVKAFAKVYSVLMSPRCMNCHPKGDIPLQGEDSHLHAMFPKRGIDGKGVYAMKCANCHQFENTLGKRTPPGNLNWHLPPADMKMVFEGKTANELAKQLIDPTKNGHKDLQKLIAHADDGLVLAGWKPAHGYALPPISHAEFKNAWLTWLEKGAYAPKK